MLRLRPAADLLARVQLMADAPAVAHLGCGDGMVSQLLRDRWLAASIRCSDISEKALAKARARLARPAEFACESLEGFMKSKGGQSFDLIFADRALQSSLHPPSTLEKLLESVRPGGAVAACLPLHESGSRPGCNTLFWQVAETLELTEDVGLPSKQSAIVESSEYFDQLRGPLCNEINIWTSTYTTTVQAGNRIGLVCLECLQPEDARRLEQAHQRSILGSWPKLKDGSCLVEASYMFIVAQRPQLVDIYTDYAAYHDHQLEKGWKS